MRIVSVTITDSRENEIADAIRSVIDWVDQVLVVDTGIADNTLTVAKEVAGDKLVVSKHEWRDFSAARNASIEEATKMGADWIVILDSDERIHFGRVNLREVLEQTSVEVLLMESSDGFYPKEKILRATSTARYLGPTHEALIGGSRDTLRGTSFSELGKSYDRLRDKFARDAELLENYLVTHGDDGRWWFYLGQSFEGMGARARAAEAYGQCVNRRQIGDEAAWAAYKQAEMLCTLEHYEAALAAAGRGIGAHPMYAECAWIGAVAASRLGRIEHATAYARMAAAVGRYNGCGTDRTWFRHLPALYELPYDVLRHTLPDAISRKQAEEHFHKARMARVGATDPIDLDRVSILRATPAHSRNEARSMLRPETLAAICPSTKSVRIAFVPKSDWHPMNPSICMWRGELWCVVRTVNYTLEGRSYHINDPEQIVRTENYLGTLTADGVLTHPRRIEDLDTSPRLPSRIVGYEDIRLVARKQGLTGSATVCDRDPDRRIIARLHFTGAGDVDEATVQTSRQWHEKNWMPLMRMGRLVWIYSIDPTVVVFSGGGSSKKSSPNVVERACPFAMEHLRGGAAIAFEGGYLAVTHETIETNEGRVYLHRLVKFDADFQVTSASQSWVFNHHGIEFCAGLVRDGDELIFSFGVDDREAWLARVTIGEVEAMKWVKP